MPTADVEADAPSSSAGLSRPLPSSFHPPPSTSCPDFSLSHECAAPTILSQRALLLVVAVAAALVGFLSGQHLDVSYNWDLARGFGLAAHSALRRLNVTVPWDSGRKAGSRSRSGRARARPCEVAGSPASAPQSSAVSAFQSNFSGGDSSSPPPMAGKVPLSARFWDGAVAPVVGELACALAGWSESGSLSERQPVRRYVCVLSFTGCHSLWAASHSLSLYI